MNIQVRYYSRSGNTKKLADRIAAAVGCDALAVDNPLNEKADILFLGSSVYAGTFDAAIAGFLENNAEKTGMLVCFGTSASGRSAFGKVKVAAEKLGIKVCDDYFNCPGHFMFLHRTRPDENDLAGAAAFAEKIKSQM